MLPVENSTVRSCDCKRNPVKVKKEEPKKTKDVFTQAQQAQPVIIQTTVPQQQTCGSGFLSGLGKFFGGLFGGLSGLCSFAVAGGAQLLGAMNSGGMNIGQLYLMNKMMKNNNNCCHSHCGSSRPVIINNYRSYPLVRSFCHPMPKSFCWRPNNIAWDGPGLFKPCKPFKPFGRNIC